MRVRGLSRVLFFLLVLVIAIPTAIAQKTSGTITGTVIDPTGAVVPAATVVIVNANTGATRETFTNDQGVFSFPEQSEGTYTLTVTKAGFKKLTQHNVQLHVADVTNLNVKMDMGAASETVVVEATAVSVNTSTGDVSNTMSGEQIRELPVNGRNFVQLTTLVPGASVGEAFDNKNKGLFAGVDISFSGSPSVGNQWTVDGAANNDIGSQRTILIYPSIDGIEEFKIQRNSYGPEYGGASGAQINIVTKGGSNSFHGDLYYFGRNDLLNAKDYFLGECAGQPGCNKQTLRRNDFGYTLGGPIKKDKIFFFWSEEWNRERRGRVQHHTVPTAAEFTGDFTDLRGCSSTGTDAFGNPIPAGMPLDPETGGRFGATATTAPTDIIPANRLSPAGQAYLAPLPLPNLSNLCGGDNWVNQVIIPMNWREENIRGDWNLTKHNTLTMRFTQDSWLNFKHADEAAGLWGDSDFPALSDTWNQPGKSALAKITTTIGTSAVNDFQFSWSGNRIYISQSGDNPALNDGINAAMPRLFPFSDKNAGQKIAEPTCWCGAPAGLLGIQGPWKNRMDLFVWKDDFSKVSGSHIFKVGFLYSRNAKDETVGAEGGELWGGGDANGPAVDYKGPGWTNPNFNGCGSTWSGPTCTAAIGTSNYYADYLLRGMTYGYDEAQHNNMALVRWRDYEFYGGDAWKINHRVTFNYGVRWFFTRAPYLDDNKLASFSPSVYATESGASKSDPCRGMVLAGGGQDLCSTLGSSVTPPHFENRSLVKNNNHMIAPRLGIAWDVFGTGRFAIRAGVGQFFSRDRLLAISMRSNNTPYGVSTGSVRTLDGPEAFSGDCTQNIINSTCNGTADPRHAGNADLCVTQGCAFDVSLGGSPHQGVDPSEKQSNSWQWNLTTETALWRNSKLELGWVANRSIHLQNAYDANQIPLADRLYAAQLAVTPDGTGGVAKHGDARNALKPFPYNTFGQMTIWSHSGDAIYHSLQALFTNKFTNNSMLQVAYTFSKNLGDTTLGYVGSGTVFADNTNHRANRGPVDFDRRHVLSATLNYNLSQMKNSNMFVRQVAGGWETNTIVNYASGNALTIQGNSGRGDLSGTATSGSFTGRPLRVAGQPCHLSSGPRDQWLNPAAFSWDGYQLGTFGNSGPGQCAGPPIDDVDFSISKNWRLGGEDSKKRVQLRFEMFNVFNHPQFRFSGTNLSVNWAGSTPVDASGADCSNNPTSCASVVGGHAIANNFGKAQFTSQSGNREIQYALKFYF
jgi:hypothetical protein